MIVHGWPPNIDEIEAALGPKDDRTIFTVWPHVYVPSGKPLPPWLVAHEDVHLHQQFGAPEAWWDMYLEDSAFRYSQELEAHRAELRAFRQHTKDRNGWARYRNQVIGRLCGPLYGNVRTRAQVAKDL